MAKISTYRIRDGNLKIASGTNYIHLIYFQPKNGLNSPSSLGCRGGNSSLSVNNNNPITGDRKSESDMGLRHNGGSWLSIEAAHHA